MSSRINRSGILLALLTVLVAWLAPTAQAEWLPPVDISDPAQHVGPPDVALDSEGNATAVWDRWDGIGTETIVESAYRPAGHPWGEPEVLSPPDSQTAQVVVDRNGYLTAIWERLTWPHAFIESSIRAPGGSWSEPVVIAQFGLAMHPEPWLAVDWEGNATAVWKEGGVIMASYRPFGQEWGEPMPLSEGESFVPETAMDSRGDATAVWMHHDGSDYVVESAYRPEQGEWGEPELVSQPGEEGGNPHVAVDGQGDSLVVWRGEDEGVEFVRAAYRPAGGSWGEPVNVSSEGEQVQQLRAAVDPVGNAIVAWSGGKSGDHDIVRAAYKPLGGEWEEPVGLSAAGGNGYPSDIVFNQSGDAAIVWQRWDGVDHRIQAAYRPAGEEWGAPVDLSEEGTKGMNPVVVLDAPGSATVADGDATAIWIGGTPVACYSGKEPPCYSYVVQAAGYDPDGLPEIEVEAPEVGIAGEPVEVSIPTEGLYAPQIDFGDGTEVAGTKAVHVYDESGAYLATATGAEELGYRASEQQWIEILPGEGEGGSDPGEGEGGSDPDGGSGGPGSAPTPVPPPPEALLGPAGYTVECLAARDARDAAAARLRKLERRLNRAEGVRAHGRLAAAKRRQLTVLRRARARIADAC